MKHLSHKLLAATILGTTLLAACGPKPEYTYSTARVERGDVINAVTATGTIEPVISVEVGTQVSGIVNKIYVDYNSHVKAGQVIAELDRSNLVSELNSAKAQLANAKAQLESQMANLEGARANLRASQATLAGGRETYASSLNTVAAAKANLASLQSKLDYQRTNYERQKKLYDQGLISNDVYDQAYLAYINAKQAVTQQQETIAGQQHSSASQNEQVSNLDANVVGQMENINSLEKSIEAQRQSIRVQEEYVRKAETNLSYATITSPIDGIVLSKEVEEGQTVASSFNTPTLFKIAQDLTNMQVIANVDEADIGEVREGQRVTFTVDAYPDDTFEGKVMQVRQEAKTESNVVTYEVVISAPNNDLKLKPGLTASVTIFTMEAKNVLYIPNKALKFTPNEENLNEGETIKDCNAAQKVWVKNDKTLKAVGIGTGMTNGINIVVTSGLSEGDSIVTDVAEAFEMPEEQNANPFMPHPKKKDMKKK